MPITARDPQTGRIIASELTPEEASERSNKRWADEAAAEAQASGAEANELLKAVGFDDPSEADATLRNLAGKAVNSVAGMKLFLNQVGKLVREERQSPAKWTGTGPCPTCGQVSHEPMALQLNVALHIYELMAELRARIERNDPGSWDFAGQRYIPPGGLPEPEPA